MSKLRFEYEIPNSYFPGIIVAQPVKAIVMAHYHFIDFTVEHVDIGISSRIIGYVSNWTKLSREIEEYAEKMVFLQKPLPERIEEEFENGFEDTTINNLYGIAQSAYRD